MEEDEQTTQTNTNLNAEDDIFRAPRSSRSLQSYGLTNGTALRSGRGCNSHRSDEEEEEDSEGLIPSVPRSSRQQLPPLQTPIGTRFMENNNAPKQRKNKKLKPKVEEVHDNPNFESSHLSVSRIHVGSRNGFENKSDDDIEDDFTRRSNSSKNNYYKEDDRTAQPNSGRKKKGKKKAQSGAFEEEEGFDTLRLSQHIEDDETLQERTENRPPIQKQGRVMLRRVEGADYREEERSTTPIKKLKKKKRSPFRKNNIAPSDEEYELSDVQGSPKRDIPWVKPSSPRRMLDDVANHTNKWGLAEDLGTVDDVGFTRRRGPNFDSEDDLIL